MAMIQSDLFGWHQESERELQEVSSEITVESLSEALIKHFGHWVGTDLLGSDWTVKETLVTIHKVFTRQELLAVTEDVWKAAWNRFEERFLTKRPVNKFDCFEWS